ncbi:MAG: hypothetical protein AB1545_17665 [Thermodesulfobacteriota bacterium]
MCDNFDDDGIDIEDAARFWGGFVETQVEGEESEQDPGDPSPEDTLKTDLDYLDDEA